MLYYLDMYVRMYARRSVCLFVYLSVSVSAYLCLSVWLSVYEGT